MGCRSPASSVIRSNDRPARAAPHRAALLLSGHLSGLPARAGARGLSGSRPNPARFASDNPNSRNQTSGTRHRSRHHLLPRARAMCAARIPLHAAGRDRDLVEVGAAGEGGVTRHCPRGRSSSLMVRTTPMAAGAVLPRGPSSAAASARRHDARPTTSGRG